MKESLPERALPEPEGDASDLRALVVRPILPREERAWDELMAAHHYLGFRQLVGESLKYVAVLADKWVAWLGWGAAALACGPRDQWIGWVPERRWQRLRLVANNQRFLVLPGVRVRNLASRVLALNLRRLSSDWQAVFGHPILLAETFVDQRRFAGTCYLAAGWSRLGESRGYGRSGRRYYFHGQPKTVWVRPLQRRAREVLAAPFDSPVLERRECMVDLNQVTIEGREGLLVRFSQLPDPRQRRWVRHTQTSILAVATCAGLAGARSFLAIGEWAASLPQEVLRRLGCRWHQGHRRFLPPSEPTIRRTLQAIDPDWLDRVVGDWLAGQCPQEAVAIDGKTLRGARRRDGGRVHLLAALVHQEGVVLAQQEVKAGSNELTATQPLLAPLDLRGKVVTADAMHAQVNLARHLVEEKGADYVFTVKGNQATLLEDIKALEEDDFSPSLPAVGPRTRSD